MTGENHPNWNPNREEVERDYGPGWYSEKEKQRESLREEQGDRDGLTGEKFKEDDVIVRHHIDYDKYNNILDNLCALTPKTHVLVTNESGMSKDEYMKTFQDAKENLKQKIPPKHWNEKNKEDYKNDIKQENNPISENNSEEQKEDNIDEGDRKEPDNSSENTNEDNNEEILEDSKQEGDKDENQSEEKGKDINDKESKESIEKNQEESTEVKEEKPAMEPKEEKEKESSEEQVPETLEPSVGVPTDEPDDQQEIKNEKSSDNLSKRSPEMSYKNSFSETIMGPSPDGKGGISIDELEEIKDKKDKEHILTSGRDYGGTKRSTDYAGIDQIERDKGEDFKGIDEYNDKSDKDYNRLDDVATEKGSDFDGIDSPQEIVDKDYDDIDEGYSEGGYEGG